MVKPAGYPAGDIRSTASFTLDYHEPSLHHQQEQVSTPSAVAKLSSISSCRSPGHRRERCSRFTHARPPRPGHGGTHTRRCIRRTRDVGRRKSHGRHSATSACPNGSAGCSRRSRRAMSGEAGGRATGCRGPHRGLSSLSRIGSSGSRRMRGMADIGLMS